jgi:nitrite reductase (NO-forming)
MSNQLLDRTSDQVGGHEPDQAARAAGATSSHQPASVVAYPTAGEVLSAWLARRGALTRLGLQAAMTVLILAIALPLASAFGWIGAPAARTTSGPPAARTFHAPTHTVYNAQPPATPQGDTVTINLTTEESLITIAPGVAYHAWTFNGTVPGPVLRVRQGQHVHFTLTNKTTMLHSIDFHAAQTPWNVNYQPVVPGKSFSFDWTANYPGVFMYHCGTPPVMDHMANGMYGAIIVDPANSWTPAREYVLVQSEFYTQQNADGSFVLSESKMMSDMPDFVVFNGYANQYKTAPLAASPGQRVRLFLVNAGPSQFSAFHVIGAVFSDVYVDGNPANHTQGDQTVTVPPGGGSVVELTMPDGGLYPFVTHSFADADKGATGVIKVGP